MDIDTKQIAAIEVMIESISKRGVPIAIQQTLSNTARNAYNEIQKGLDSKFTIRNAWTGRSMSYQRAQGLDIDNMSSEVGSVSDYMRKQEDGFETSSGGLHGVQVPTSETAGQSGLKRTKPIRNRFKRTNIDLAKIQRRFKNPKQQRVAEIIETMRAGNRFWFGELKGTIGMWYLKGGRPNKKSGWPKGMRPKLLYSANKKRVKTKSTRWLEVSTEMAIAKQPDEYAKALSRQLDRLSKKARI